MECSIVGCPSDSGVGMSEERRLRLDPLISMGAERHASEWKWGEARVPLEVSLDDPNPVAHAGCCYGTLVARLGRSGWSRAPSGSAATWAASFAAARC